MKRFPSVSMALALLCLISLAAKTLHAQEWSPAQKEVWKVEEEMISLLSKGDIEGLYKHYHRDYVWWNYDSPVPFGYESGKRFDILMRKHSKLLALELKPLTILAYDSFAVVNFVLAGYYSEDGGKPQHFTWRETDVLKKEGTQWLLVAHHAGAYSDLK